MKRFWFACLSLCLMVTLAACGASPAQPVSVRVTSPRSGDAIAVNAAVSIRGEISGDNVAQVRVRVNGQTYQQLPASQLSGVIVAQWSPQFAGQQIIFLEAYDANNALLARSEVVIVNAVVSTTTTTATPATASTALSIGGPETPTVAVATDAATATAAATTTVTAATATAASTTAPALTLAPTQPATLAPTVVPATATAAATATKPVAQATPAVTVLADYDFANLRSGPGTNYDVVGRLAKGQSATVVGKSADGQWWQVNANGKTAWVAGQLVQANAASSRVAVAKAPALPTFTPTSPVPSPSTTVTATAQVTATAAVTPTVPVPGQADCDERNSDWGGRVLNDPAYTFCIPTQLDVVPHANPDPDVIIVNWEVYGNIKSLELRMDPYDNNCGRGDAGFRQQVKFKVDDFLVNTRFLKVGGYKLSLAATMNDGRILVWGNVNFCGKAK